VLTPRHSLGWRVGGQLTLRISFIVSSRRGDLDYRIVDRAPQASPRASYSSVPYCHSFAPSTMAPSSSLQLLRDRLGLSGQAGVWKFLAILFALLNLKNLPFAWHVSPPNPSLWNYSILADLLPDPPSQRPLHPHPLLPRPHCLQTRPCRPLSTHDHFFTLWLSRMRLQSP
jgi:hypothetical protein